ncbi:MAG: hypothetical protein ABI972_26645 [Acidobacteriota bacterium]
MVPTFHQILNAPAHPFRANELSDFVGRLRHYELPPALLPFARNRQPFADLNDAAIECALRNTVALDHKVGRLSDAIRIILGLPSIVDSTTIATVEAHVDVTAAPLEIAHALVALGFEPDDFVKLEPECYKRHFTLKLHVSSVDGPVLRRLISAVHRASGEAASILQKDATVDAFIEEEVYTPKYKRSYGPRPFDVAHEAQFPGNLRGFRVQLVPRSHGESDALGMPLTMRKAADIHVKLFGEAAPLARQLQEAGFYEIVSEAGNRIYTGQYMTVREARRVYDTLDAFLRNSGGATSLILEVCTAFWRRLSADGVLAPVSPVLVREAV